jgi:hypothetical protein
MMEGTGADSEEKREPVSDIYIVMVDSLKALDLERPTREAAVSKVCLEFVASLDFGAQRSGMGHV